MTKLLIGTGGWAYFKVPGLRPLEAYSRAFDFVEVNSTFYQIPDVRTVRSWRKQVPQDFEFSVRCHRDVTHKYKMEPREEAYETFSVLKRLCEILNSDMLILQTPRSLKLDGEGINSIRDFLSTVDKGNLKLIWEMRQQNRIPKSLISLMRDHRITQCVDLSRREPLIDSEILYTRLFGRSRHNIYQFTDEELEDIDRRIRKKEYAKAVLSFHSVKMYMDAARYKTYKQTGSFPPVTEHTGLESLEEVLGEDAKFPMTKEELIRDQGWKQINLTKDRRVRAGQLLRDLPSRSYRSADEVINALRML